MNNDLLWHLDSCIIPAAFSLLPAKMSSREARAMLLATAMQESGLKYRRQMIGKPMKPLGPARGFWQFELAGGVVEILTSMQTKQIIVPIADMLCVDPTAPACHEAITHNDILAACFARLLLYRDPRALPSPVEAEKGWSIYVNNWRPGKPHPEGWRDRFDLAWSTVKGV